MRTKHKPTDETRARVEWLAAVGTHRADICIALDCTMAELEEHYLDHLQRGRVRKRAVIVEKLGHMVEEGSIRAMDKVLEMMDKADMVQRPQDAEAEKPAPTAKLGKKEQAMLAAQSPDTDTTLGDLMSRRTAGHG